jgi:hypothetical protein
LYKLLEGLDPLSLRTNLSNQVWDFDEEINNLILNGLHETCSAIDQSYESSDKDERDTGLASNRLQFAFNTYFVGLMTLVDVRFGKIARDLQSVTETRSEANDFKLSRPADSRSLVMGLLRTPSDPREARLNLKSVNEAMKECAKGSDPLFERIQAAKMARNLIVHPKDEVPEIDQEGNIFWSESKEQNLVRKIFPDLVDQFGGIQADEAFISELARDAFEVIRRIVDYCEFHYLMLLHEHLTQQMIEFSRPPYLLG